ncbi:MAG: amidohydrolase [Gammaproteobacteria bacterium]|nr:MAG: amidohydrolase [Gammaproteobacteria bacterium]
MSHDLVIRGGSIVDGTGSEPVTGDLAIDGNTITQVGTVQESGHREIDARGHLVTPGFVDTHTHLDAQIGWDPMLTPVSWHGVTTALLGNCGVTFAPCRKQDREFLASMMETVEDIPKDAILGGLPWNWEGYGGYLDALQTLSPAINVAGLVGHCAVRYYVMGERAIDDQSTAEEKQRMAEVVADSLKAGAVGFSTSRFLGHVIPDGRHVPGTHADHDELIQIATAVGKHGGLMQNVLNLAGDFEGEVALLEAEARASGNRVLFSNTAGKTHAWGKKLGAKIDALRAQGLDINGISIPRGSGFLTGLQGMLVWQGEAWEQLAKQDLAQRLISVRDARFAARLVAEAEANPSRFDARQMFWLGAGDAPDYDFDNRQSLQATADANAERPVETFLRISRDTDGKALFTVRFFNQNTAALADLISTDWCMPGLGDAGAHVGQIMDAGWATFVMSHWARDAGLYSTGEAVRRITSVPARLVGMKDRGILAPGMRADVNVIDLQRLHERMPEMVHDFPGGAARFIQRATGYKATVCNGQIILEDDEHTGIRAGEVIRN